MLHAESLTIRRGRRTLIAGLNITLQPGELVHLVGPNGAGKSSLLTTLAGLREPEAGEIYWADTPIRRQREQFLSQLQLLSHRRGLGRRATALEALRLAAQLGDLATADSGSVNDHAMREALGAVGLRSAADKPVAQLSAGQQRRVALAKLTLAFKPLWLLDEPLTALDRDGVRLVEQLLDQHRQAGGMAIVTSHQPLALQSVRTVSIV